MKYLILILLFASCASKPAEFYYSQGKNESTRTNYYVSIDFLTKAINKKPKYIDAYSERASAYMQVDSIDNALKDYDSLLVFTKGSQQKQGELYYLKGNAHYLLSMDTIACKEWKTARDLNCYGAWEKIRKFCK